MVFLDNFCCERQNLFCRAGVKRRSVLIEKQQLRGIVGCHHKCQRLPLPAGKKTYGLAHAIFQPHAEKRHTFTQLLFFLLCQPVQPAALSGGKREVFLNGHAGRAAAHRVLKEPADLASSACIRA